MWQLGEQLPKQKGKNNMCNKCNENHGHTYVCECGKEFPSVLSMGGHQANCKVHQKLLEEEREKRRLPNGLFKCENPDCPNEHDGSYGTGRFCSEHCRRVYIGKHSIDKRMSNGTFKSPFQSKINISRRSPYGTWTCLICGIIFNTRAELKHHMDSVHPYDKSHAWNYGKTKETDNRIKASAEKVSKTLKEGFNSGRIKPVNWSEENRLKQSKRAKERKLGGYHKHGGRGIRGWYRGYWCDSSWELAYVIYNIEHGIHFVRNRVGFDYFYDGMTRKYYPDYILDDGTYVEVKGYVDEKVKVKHETFISSGHTLQVIGKSEIQPYLDYAIEKYGKDFTSLYE